MGTAIAFGIVSFLAGSLLGIYYVGFGIAASVSIIGAGIIYSINKNCKKLTDCKNRSGNMPE